MVRLKAEDVLSSAKKQRYPEIGISWFAAPVNY